MDDFRVGSVPPSEPYGDRHPYDAAARKRQRHHHDGEDGEPQDEDATDTFEASDGVEPSAPAGETIEDYYRPAPPPEDDL